MSWRQSVSDATSSSEATSSRVRGFAWLAAIIAVCGGSTGCNGSASGIRSADTSVYVRSDTDSTTVINPRAHVGARFADKFGLDATYAMDSWTGASIDVVTAATGAIHELRHEINTAASFEQSNVRMGANYRYSTENDYWSHGGVVNFDLDLAQKNTTLSMAVLGSLDTVGRAGWDDFRKPQDSIGGRLSYLQVLDAKTLLQLSADFVRISGFQASPYRYVAFNVPANDGGLCRGIAMNCTEEIHPRERMRTAFSAKLRRAFGSVFSMGLDYRYYFDDWGLDSHTITPDFAFLIGEHGTLSADYRFYTQSHADFYQASYHGEGYKYLTRDRKLSPMMQHHAGLEYRHEVPMGESGNTVFLLGVRGAYTLILYSDFVGLSRVDVIEGTAMLGLLFR